MNTPPCKSKRESTKYNQSAINQSHCDDTTSPLRSAAQRTLKPCITDQLTLMRKAYNLRMNSIVKTPVNIMLR